MSPFSCCASPISCRILHMNINELWTVNSCEIRASKNLTRLASQCSACPGVPDVRTFYGTVRPAHMFSFLLSTVPPSVRARFTVRYGPRTCFHFYCRPSVTRAHFTVRYGPRTCFHFYCRPSVRARFHIFRRPSDARTFYGTVRMHIFIFIVDCLCMCVFLFLSTVPDAHTLKKGYRSIY